MKAAGQIGKAAAASAANLAHNAAAAYDPMFDSSLSESEDGEGSVRFNSLGRSANTGVTPMKNPFVLKDK